jgi:LysM repeat protein
VHPQRHLPLGVQGLTEQRIHAILRGSETLDEGILFFREGGEDGSGRVIGTSPETRSWQGRREALVRGLAAAGIIVLAACGAEAGESAKATRSGTPTTTTTAAPTTTTTPPPTTYQVKRGDNLTAIARFFGVSSAAIAAANQLGGGDRLTEGQVLQIPPSPPAGLTVTPPDGIAGMVFTFTVRGAKVGEAVTFQVVAPGGGTFTGSPHAAAQDGSVTASYRTDGDAAGKYDVVATGDRGTSLRASYRLLG